MNKQELIEKIENLNKLYGEGRNYVAVDAVLELVEQLDEPETGHADEAPRYVKNILARLRELPEHDREVWLKAIMGEFERDFSHAKWREGYEVQETKYVVTDGNHLYFKNYQEDIEIVILVDEQPGTMEYVKKFNTKEEAQKAADILGWKVQEVE